MKETQLIRDFYGKILGRIEVDEQGNKTVRDFYGRLLGRYNKRQNVTRDFYGKLIARGDATSMLINSKR